MKTKCQFTSYKSTIKFSYSQPPKRRRRKKAKNVPATKTKNATHTQQFNFQVFFSVSIRPLPKFYWLFQFTHSPSFIHCFNSPSFIHCFNSPSFILCFNSPKTLNPTPPASDNAAIQLSEKLLCFYFESPIPQRKKETKDLLPKFYSLFQFTKFYSLFQFTHSPSFILCFYSPKTLNPTPPARNNAAIQLSEKLSLFLFWVTHSPTQKKRKKRKRTEGLTVWIPTYCSHQFLT